MFGTEVAENLNNSLYVWKSDAPKIFVYYKTEEEGANAAGSVFSAGTVALSGFAGLAIGAIAAVLCLKVLKKKKENVA